MTTQSAVSTATPVHTVLPDTRQGKRLGTILAFEGIHTVGDLTTHTAGSLLMLPQIGPTYVDQLEQALAAHGLALLDGTRTEIVMGITTRQLNYWVYRGLLHPTDPAPGSGRPREWPDSEIEIGRRMGRLARAGLPLEWSAAFARDGWPDGQLAPGIWVRVT